MSVEGTAGGWVVVGILALISLVAIVSNILLIYLVISKPELRENINYFVLSLAAVDLLTALVIVPLQGYHSAVEVTTEGALCVCLNILAVMTAMASILSLLCVTVDRYLAISRPLRYVTLVTPRRVTGVLTFAWIYSVCLGLLILIPDEVAVGPPTETNNSTASCNITSLIGVHYGFFLLCNFFIPVPVVFFMYAHIFFIARRHAKAIHDVRRVSCVDPAVPRPSLMKQNIRIAVVLSVITVYVLISWTCTLIIFALMEYLPEHEFELTVAYKVIFYMNAATNPLFYMFHHKTLRTHLVTTVRRKLSRVPPGAVGPSPLVSTVSFEVPLPTINSLFKANSRRPSFLCP